MPAAARRLGLALLLAAGGCCSYGPGDGGYPTASHTEPVQVANLGGPTLGAIQLVTVTYADDPLRATDEAFGSWVVTSAWWAAVGKDYGLDAGTAVNVELTQDAPSAVTDVGIDGQLTSWVQDGTLPKPTPQTLYLVYFPASTAVTTSDQTVISCTYAAGYHAESQSSQSPFAYAVVPTCPSAASGTLASEVQGVASHEILEAATDPLPGSNPAYQLPQTSPWNLGTGSAGGELADLCFPLSTVDDGYTVSRGWSNSSAAAGGDPCVPTDPGAPYFSVSPVPETITLPPGGTAKVTLLGWATGPLPAPWTIGAGIPGVPANSLQSFVTITPGTLENDGIAQLQLSAAGLPLSGTFTLVVYSQATDLLGGNPPDILNHESYWPITVTVP